MAPHDGRAHDDAPPRHAAAVATSMKLTRGALTSALGALAAGPAYCRNHLSGIDAVRQMCLDRLTELGDRLDVPAAAPALHRHLAAVRHAARLRQPAEIHLNRGVHAQPLAFSLPGLELGLSANIGFFRYAQICPAGHGLLRSE